VSALGSNRFDVSTTVRNTGARPGAEVVELYVGDPASIGEPPRQLKAFAKLAIGRSRTVTLRLGAAGFAHYDTAAGAWRVTGGRYRIYLGTSSRDLPQRTSVNVGGEPG
jgi:beta-glucosidase